jgi:hypothetical protein
MGTALDTDHLWLLRSALPEVRHVMQPGGFAARGVAHIVCAWWRLWETGGVRVGAMPWDLAALPLGIGLMLVQVLTLYRGTYLTRVPVIPAPEDAYAGPAPPGPTATETASLVSRVWCAQGLYPPTHTLAKERGG